MDKDVLKKLCSHKDPDVKNLAEEYTRIMSSHYFDSYKTLYNQMKDWNSQLEIKKIKVEGDDSFIGKIDLFADKDEKSFERAFRYFSELVSMNETLDKLRSKMNSDEQSKISEEIIGSSYEKALDKLNSK